mmetsp:Transcript_102315/g.296000  ORF Transcript_102315/g.296000 Transcript_102315/m.296000 type:complete len:215 (+) Transcript_102315:1040-1684(+)
MGHARLALFRSEFRVEDQVVQRLALASLSPHDVHEVLLQVRGRHLLRPLLGLRLDVAGAPAQDADVAPQRLHAFAFAAVQRLECPARHEARLFERQRWRGLIGVVLAATPTARPIGLDAQDTREGPLHILRGLQRRKVLARDHKTRCGLLLARDGLDLLEVVVDRPHVGEDEDIFVTHILVCRLPPRSDRLERLVADPRDLRLNLHGEVRPLRR